MESNLWTIESNDTCFNSPKLAIPVSFLLNFCDFWGLLLSFAPLSNFYYGAVFVFSPQTPLF